MYPIVSAIHIHGIKRLMVRWRSLRHWIYMLLSLFLISDRTFTPHKTKFGINSLDHTSETMGAYTGDPVRGW